MTKLMEKRDWMQTVANVGTADGVWYDNISSEGGVVPLSVPESGMYQVILVKIDDSSAAAQPVQPLPRKKPNIRDFIGYGEKFHKLRPTEEWMKELREGEED